MTSRERAWLKRRKQFITASDAAAALGLHPSRKPMDIYLEKVGLGEVVENEAMRWGKRLEQKIAAGYGEESGRLVHKVKTFDLIEHPDVPFLAATLDDTQSIPDECPNPAPEGANGDGVLEVKNYGMFVWKHEAPIAVQIQVQIQLSCTQRDWGTAVQLYRGTTCRWQDMLRDDEFLKKAISALDKFWWHVQNRIPPEPKYASELEAVKTLYLQATNTEPEPVELPEEAVDLWVRHEDAKAKIKALEEQRDVLNAKLRVILGEATHGLTKSGDLLVSKVTPVKGYTRVVKPSTHRKIKMYMSKGKEAEDE